MVSKVLNYFKYLSLGFIFKIMKAITAKKRNME
ncbi:hypothetical protein GGR42_001018 [Saonia flava]|uniref:Uncharacterized protein n=1 Tax=Saonia flava TaxID=523696 RepID=A0A846QND5_9FLAO|nr:hypothetical protein [Saonia flava]